MSREREILELHERYLETRRRAERGEVGWDALGAFFTDDAVFVDPAWGRVEGRDAVVRFLPGGRVAGDSGCGPMLGNYTTNGTTIDITDLQFQSGNLARGLQHRLRKVDAGDVIAQADQFSAHHTRAAADVGHERAVRRVLPAQQIHHRRHPLGYRVR